LKNLVIIILAIFLSSCSKKEKHVGIQVLGTFNKTSIEAIKSSIYDIYGFKVSVLKPQHLPEYAFVNIKSPRYRADKIIYQLQENRDDSIDIVLGLMEKDISTTKHDSNGDILKPESKYKDWGVFGLGYRPGHSCIVSTYRLRRSNKNQFINRLQKISIHEIGHNLGLKHCPNEQCVMRDAAESIKTIDNVHLGLCPDCKNKIE